MESKMTGNSNLSMKSWSEVCGVYKKLESSKLKILIDVDDVLIDLLGAWCKWLNERHGTTVAPDDITVWDMSKAFPTLTKGEIYEPLNTDAGFWDAVEVKPGAEEYIKRLVDDGHEVYLCTSTDYRNIKVKYENIINRYFPCIKWDHIILTYDKQMLKADMLIDDGVQNLEGGDFIKVLMTAPHNRLYDAAANDMFRVDSWSMIYELINKYVLVGWLQDPKHWNQEKFGNGRKC